MAGSSTQTRSSTPETGTGVLDRIRCLVWDAEVRAGRGGVLEWTPEVRNPEGAARFLPLDVQPGETYTQAWLRCRNGEDRLAGAHWSEESIREGRPFTQEYRCTRADGTVRWLREDVEVECLGTGHWRATAVVTDITDRKRGEEARTHLAAVFEATTDYVITTDPDGQLLYANAAARRLLGIPHGAELSRVRLPWKERLQEGFRTASEQGAWRGEATLPAAAGRAVQVSAVVTAHRRADGQVQFLSTVARDITERKRFEDALREAEARFRVIAEAAPVGIFLTDPRGALLYVNPEGLRQAGLDSGSAAGERWQHAIHPEDREAVRREWREVIRERRAYEQTHRFQREEGTVVWVEVNAAPVYEAGQLIGFVGVSSDVTRRGELEEQLRHVHKMEAVGRLAGGIAHDFNNVLAVINGYADLLLREMDPADPVHEPLAEIRKAGERAASLTRQLLAYSRRQLLKPVHLDLNTVVENLTGMLRRVLGEHIRLESRGPGEPVHVFADVGQMEQVILNLAVNARDAMPDGGTLRLSVDSLELAPGSPATAAGLEPGPYALLTVSDTGAGIPSGVLEHIFEPFFTTKAVGEGTGLGLSTVYGIVRQSGGHIEVETGPGGSTFRTYLPLVRGRSQTPSEPESLAVPRGAGRVLLVEDEPGVRTLVRRVLEKCGYAVVETRSAVEALQCLRERSFTALVTDVLMPQMSGPQLVQRARELYPKIPALLMTGYSEDVLDGVEIPGCALIRKPFTPEALAEQLDRLIAATSGPDL